MFKLESYITPLLLGYVDKYIKNLKSEDFQLSLWGGDAVFTNLDLRLDVLEDEFRLPFTFTNGHIHELRIHVPWTKLGSEPIVITIETIECVLTLKGDSDSDGTKNQKLTQEIVLKRKRKSETPEAPPGYVQGFINRILSNISIVCNNLILKYVEDDIVLSLNIKSAEMYNVNNSWERAFTELNAQNPVLRRVINMLDLTMCLDKRNASGIIEVYQDPLLFRCSAWCRLHSVYENPHSKLVTTTRVSVFCEQLDFSITDQQLPMLFRLIQLCLALISGEINTEHKASNSTTNDKDEKLRGEDEYEGEMSQSGWGSWAWSYVPQILPVWDENGEEGEEGNYQRSLASHIFQFRLLIERTSLVFKRSETATQPTKLAFHSIALSRLYGTSICLTLQGNRFVNSQLGITAAEVTNMDTCICGGCQTQENDKVYFQSGVMPGDGHTFSFLTASLFDPLSAENCSNATQDIIVEWEKHLDYLTEAVMNERYPSIAFDFLYDIEIPPEWTDKSSDFTATFLESSNWRERSLCRVVIGKSCINASSSLIHLIRYVINCGMDHDYAPYTSTQQGNATKAINYSEEDIQALREFVPIRNIHVIWHQPLIRIQMADHHCLAISNKHLKKQKSRKILKEASPKIPLLLSASMIEIQLSEAFYPQRLNGISSNVENISGELVQHCYNHANAKIFNLEVLLHAKPQLPIVIIPPFSLAAYKKTIPFPQFWKKHQSFILSEIFFEFDQWNIRVTKSRAMYLGCLIYSWLHDAPVVTSLVSTLLADIGNRGRALIGLNISGLNFHHTETQSSLSYKGYLTSLKVTLDNEEIKTTLFNAPEDISLLSNSSTVQPSNSVALEIDPLPFISIICQLPKEKMDCYQEPTILVFKMQGFVLNFEPDILSWLEMSLGDIFVDAPSAEPVIQSMSSAASSHSNEMSSTYSLGRTVSANTLAPINAKKSAEEETFSSILVKWFNIFKRATVQVDIENGCILCPTLTWLQNPESLNEGILSHWMRYVKSVQVSALIINTPRLKIASHGSVSLFEPDIPYVVENPDDLVKFPWSLKFLNFYVSTLGLDGKNYQYLLRPANASLTLAITDAVSQLSFCIHLDLESLYLSVAKDQIIVVTYIIDQALNCAHQSISTFSELSRAMDNQNGSNATHNWNVLPTTYEAPHEGSRKEEPLMSPVSEYHSAIDECQASAIKLTMWLQCTLPKVGISLFSNGNETLLKLEAEEVTASLDIQDVFIKGKAKVTTFAINSYQKSCAEGEVWKPGLFEGVILSVGDKITRNTSVPSHLAHNGHSSEQHLSGNQKNASFLSLTYTRVLNSSVEKFWAKKLKDLPLDSKNASKESVHHVLENKPKYISEFDVKMDQFDLLLWIPLISSVTDILSPVKTLSNNSFLVSYSNTGDFQKGNSLTYQLNVQNLPLVYLQMGGMRVFLPSTTEDISTRPIDTSIVQIGKIVLSPQAENTLPRILLNDTFYKAAEKAGTLGVPGSLVEDRQYQLDLRKISLTGASWKEIRERSKISRNVPLSMNTGASNLILGQNPAVEWNKRGIALAEGDEDQAITLQPIIMAFDLRVVAAPAIICVANKNTAIQDVQVCGHSLELNAVTDVNIYFSFQQMALISDIIKDNLSKGSGYFGDNLNATQSATKSSKVNAPTTKDSGIESEVADLAFASVLTGSLMTDTEDTDKQVPVEILLTANKVAVMVFLNESDLTRKMKVISVNKRKVHRRNKCGSNKALHQQLSPLQEDRLSNIKRKKPPRCNKKNFKPDIPPSNESSPERLIQSSSTRKRKKSTTTIADSSEDGYEGSNDSSSSCPQKFQIETEPGTSENAEISSNTSARIHPFLYMVFSQPHTFISWHAASQKLQVSCFDLSVKSGRHNYFIDVSGPVYCPLPSHFPVPWLETKPGDTNPKTGIPPPLVTITIKDFVLNPAEISLSIERPTLLHFSLNRWDQLNAVTHSAKSLFSTANFETEPVEDKTGATVQPEDSVKSVMRIVKRVNVSTIQIALIADGPPSLLEQFAFSVSSFENKSEVVMDKAGKHWNSDFKIMDFQLKINSGSCQSRHIIGPHTLTMAYKISWPSWNEMEFCNPISRINIHSGPLFVTIAPKQLTALKSFINFWMTFNDTVPGKDAETEAERQPAPIPASKRKDSVCLKTNDDIRNGSFKFVHDWDGYGQLPEPGEVVFGKDPSTEKQGTMTWCYSQPRVITKVDVYPVPLKPLEDPQYEDQSGFEEEIDCSLQYYDYQKQTFLNYQHFKLVESCSQSLELPFVAPDTVHEIACTDIWRVTLKCDDPETENLPILPNVLAACMRVDSLFDPYYIPTLKISLDMDMAQFTFCNHFKNGSVPDSLFPYELDEQLAPDQEFMVVNLDSGKLTFSNWSSKKVSEASCSFGCQLVDYRNLTLQPLIDPVDIHGQIIFTNHHKKRDVIETELNIHPCYVRIGQSAIHTLNIAAQAWTQVLDSNWQKQSCKQIIPNYYVVCNNTQENIRFGQVGTEESILLTSNQLHAYSWRTHKAQQMLRVCLESMHWKWCEPFSIDTEGVKVRVMECKGQSLTLVLRIQKINNVQKQVIVTGQIFVTNRLDFPFDVRLFNQRTTASPLASECRLPQSPSDLAALSTLPAFLLHSNGNPTANVQIRQQVVDAPWSEYIPLMGKKAKKHQIIEIPGHKTVKIWCHILSQEILPYVTIYYVVLAPLYVLRNHLSTPVLVHIEKSNAELPVKEIIEISGRGKDYLISSSLILDNSSTEKPSGNGAHLLFQLAAGMETSSPAIELSDPENDDGEIEESKSEPLEDFCFNWLPIEPYVWPYDDHEKECDLKKLLRRNVLCQYEPPTLTLNATEVPNTVLNVSFYKPWPKINTVLVDIKPWALLVNRSKTDLFLKDPSGHEWFLAKDSVLTPPLLQHPFTIGLEIDAQIFYSRSMRIVEALNEDEEETKGGQDLILLPKSVTPISIWITFLKKVCTLLVDIQVREKVYIISIRPHVYISNCSTKPLNIISFISPNSVPVRNSDEISQDLAPKQETLSSILLWDCASPLDTNINYNYCLSFSINENSSATNKNVFSSPILISSLKQVSSFRRTVSLSSGQGLSLPFILSFHWKSDSLYIVVRNDLSPFLCLHNYTNTSLNYGQSLDTFAVGEVKVLEESSEFYPPPKIESGEVAFYTFPQINGSFPSMPNKLPTLHLSKTQSEMRESKRSKEKSLAWCSPIDITEEVDHFAHIPDVGDVRVHKEKVGHTMHVFLESVNRIEVSAKEIRSRIGSPCKPVRQMSDVKPIPKLSKESSKIELPSSPKQAFNIELPKPTLVKKQAVVFVSLLANHFCGIICDDVSSPQQSRELLRISVDRLCLLQRPSEISPSRISSYSVSKQDITLCVGSIQIDNQLAHGSDSNSDYDFNVLLVPENQKPVVLSTPKDISTLSYIAKCTESSFITIHVALARIHSKHETEMTVVIEKLTIDVKPVALYLEDTLYYQMIQLLAKTEFLHFYATPNAMISNGNKIPKTILTLCEALSQPLPIVQLEVKPMTVLLSLHASLKLFLAIDHSPLSFKTFQNKYLFTTSYELGQRLTVHYLTGALLRAGWVVGSLDLLGNPAGLARALSMGVSDMVLLPYRGILQGPWAFLAGMSHGTISFLRQISSGTVTSVTNMASSISRNMDKLSLDEEHLKRQKLMRRQSVDGLTSGILQGLSGFGISVLGAVAGLIDQPLQAVISEKVSSSSGATYLFRAATGIVGGTGKGLVGMVVKPIGGAAEFISQTGQGLLQGVGWQIQPNPRYLPINSNLAAFANTHLKYSRKLLHSSLSKEALFFLEATHVTSMGHRVSDVLVLTPQVLCVVNKDEDKQEQTFALTEIDCLSCPTDNSLIFITLKPIQESVMPEVDKETNDRVADYVNKISSELGHAITEQRDPGGQIYDTGVIWRDAYQFCVYPKLRDYFLTIFQIEQFKALGKRYP